MDREDQVMKAVEAQRRRERFGRPAPRALSIPCPTCGAGVGERCMAPRVGTRPARPRQPHTARRP